MKVTESKGKVIVEYVAGGIPYEVTYKSKVDALLGHIQRELGIRRIVLMDLMGVNSSVASRLRNDVLQFGIPPHWFLSAHEVSGIPVDELRAVACTPSKHTKHERARK